MLHTKMASDSEAAPNDWVNWCFRGLRGAAEASGRLLGTSSGGLVAEHALGSFRGKSRKGSRSSGGPRALLRRVWQQRSGSSGLGRLWRFERDQTRVVQLVFGAYAGGIEEGQVLEVVVSHIWQL